MHIVFVSYYSFACNSAGHIACLANALVRLENEVSVFVPFDSGTATLHGEVLYAAYAFDELEKWQASLHLKQDILLVAWTPRENVRQFVERFRTHLPCPYVVHLEDNERLITELNLGLKYEDLEKLSSSTLSDRLGPDQRLSHPHYFPEFLKKAAGLTALMDTLGNFAQPDQPLHIFWPGYNHVFFGPRPINYERRNLLGISSDEVVLAYTGNVHNANRREVLSLYLATTILNRLGIKSRLVRTGENYVRLITDELDEVRSHVIELGKLASQTEVCDVIAMANVLVQPGKSDPFNDFRFPSKIPEFFALGRPIMIPATNLGRFVRDAEECIVLQRGDAFEIATHIQSLISDPIRCDLLSHKAVDFARRYFQWNNIAKDYLAFLNKLSRSNQIHKNSEYASLSLSH